MPEYVKIPVPAPHQPVRQDSDAPYLDDYRKEQEDNYRKARKQEEAEKLAKTKKTRSGSKDKK